MAHCRVNNVNVDVGCLDSEGGNSPFQGISVTFAPTTNTCHAFTTKNTSFGRSLRIYMWYDEDHCLSKYKVAANMEMVVHPKDDTDTDIDLAAMDLSYDNGLSEIDDLFDFDAAVRDVELSAQQNYQVSTEQDALSESQHAHAPQQNSVDETDGQGTVMYGGQDSVNAMCEPS